MASKAKLTIVLKAETPSLPRLKMLTCGNVFLASLIAVQWRTLMQSGILDPLQMPR